MDYLQEEYYPPPSTTSIPAAPPPQSQPHHGPATPSQTTQNDISYAAPDSAISTNTADPNETHDPTDPYNGMPPPPPATYSTLEDLMTACQSHARTHGYACVTSSNNHKRGIAYVRCDRGGHYANHWNLTPETRTRHNRTRRLVGCTWKARAKRLKTGEWELRMMEDHHSGHGRSGDAKQHPSLRKLGGEAVEEARGMFREGRGPKEVLERLRVWNASVTAQDVYNLKAKIAREAEGGSGKGKGRKSAANGEGGSGARAGADVAVDPALQLEASGAGTGPRAPAARMQDVEMQDLTYAEASSVAAAGSGEAATQKEKGKCQCKCCEH